MGRSGFSLPVYGRWRLEHGAAEWRASVGHGDAAADRIRAEMLRVAATLRGSRATVVCEAIGGSRTLEELGGLRRSLQLALAEQRGELNSLRLMMRIDAMLLEVWPDAPVSRPASLG
jgi:hypothetical protein